MNLKFDNEGSQGITLPKKQFIVNDFKHQQ